MASNISKKALNASQMASNTSKIALNASKIVSNTSKMVLNAPKMVSSISKMASIDSKIDLNVSKIVLNPFEHIKIKKEIGQSKPNAPIPSRQGTFAAHTGDPQKPKAAKEPCRPSHATAPRNGSSSIERNNEDCLYLLND